MPQLAARGKCGGRCPHRRRAAKQYLLRNGSSRLRRAQGAIELVSGGVRMDIFRRAWFAITAFFALWSSMPGHAAPPLEIYGRLPGFEMAAISPSGERIGLIGVVGEKRQLLVTDRTKELLLKIDVGDHKVRRIDWAGENNLLVLISQTVKLDMSFTAEKAELANMLVVPLDRGAKPWWIFQGDQRITGGIRGFYGVIQRNGHWYGYFGGITLAMRYGADRELGSTKAELYEIDLQTQKAALIARRSDGDDVWRDWVVGADGKVVASLDFASRPGKWTLRAGERREIASGISLTGDIDLLGLGRTTDTVSYFLRDKEGNGRLLEVPLNGGESTEILTEPATGRYLVDDRSRLLIGYSRDGDIIEEHFFDRRRDRLMAAARKAFPGVTVRLIDSNEAFDRLIVQADGVGEPQSWWTVDLKTGSADRIGVGYTMRTNDIGPMRMFHYAAADGLAMAGVLTLPPDRTPKALPLVVLPHGGPAARDYPVFDWWAQAYASRGYAVFQPNFRGSTGQGEAFRIAGQGEWGRKMQTDISDGVAALAREGIVDPRRACIVGASYGGYAALAGVTLQQGLYRCAVSVAGVADVHRMVTTDIRESGRDPTLIRALKAEVGSGRDLKMVSPVNFAERADAPILLIHGVDDTVVPFAQSRAMASALVRVGKPVELLQLDGEDHWLSRSETRLAMLKAAVAFVEKHNPPDPAAAAAR
jgi:dipeptidyl aminopeptidase/acylaminoacyl peptidase